MSNESLTFRYPIFDKILFGFGTVMFAFVAYIVWLNQVEYKNRLVVAFLAFATLCLISFLYSFYSVTLNSKEIIVWRYFRERKLAWDDIYEVFPDSLDCFSLSDRNGDVKVFISSQVKDYLQLVWLIKKRCPDIWKVRDTQTFQEIKTFHQRPWTAIYYGLGSIGMIVGVFVIPSSGNIWIDYLGRLLGLIVGSSVFILVARTPRKLEFQGPLLIFSFYGGWEKSIHANEAKVFYVKREITQGGAVNILYLELENGKKLNFGNYKEGIPMLVSAFERWMKEYKSVTK